MFKSRKTRSSIAVNLLGNFIPIFAAIICIPKLVAALGVANFGLLAIIWAIIGYAGIFDLGISRSLVYFASMSKIERERFPLNQIVSKATKVLLVGGALCAIVFILFSEQIAGFLLRENRDLLADGKRSMMLIGFIVPFSMLANAYRGVLEGLADFQNASIIKAVGGALLFVAPLITLSVVDVDVYVIGFEYLIIRVALVFWTYRVVIRSENYIESKKTDRRFEGSILRYSRNTLVSSIVSPLMVYGDRFVLSHVIGASAVGIYTIIQESIGRTVLVSASVAATYQPIYSGLKPKQLDRYKSSQSKWVAVLALAFFTGGMAAPWLIEIWSGVPMENYRGLIYVFTAAIFVNSLAQFPYALLLAQGRPDYPAKFHTGEFIIYLPIVVLMIQQFGIYGAAISFLVRVIVDFILLEWAARRVMR